MSTQIVDFQKLIGVTPDGDFGPATAKAAMKYFGLTPVRAAHFLGQCEHESGGFKVFSENLNYSADGLQKIFKKYFPTEASTKGYARNPVAIANRVYSSRMGNGPESSGDGWKYRGRGLIQLTFKKNYENFAKYIKDPEILLNPDLVSSKYAFQSALWFFIENDIFDLCTDITPPTVKKITKLINGGYNGLDDRILQTKKFYKILS